MIKIRNSLRLSHREEKPMSTTETDPTTKNTLLGKNLVVNNIYKKVTMYDNIYMICICISGMIAR